MPLKDYYSILGVAQDADEAAIKKAHRKLARDFHPDRNPDNPSAEERFKEIQEAYDTLGNAQKRRAYDARRRGFGGGGGFGGAGSGNFEDFFSQSGTRYRANRDGSYVRFDTGGGGAGAPFEDLDDAGDLFSRFFGGAAGARTRSAPGRDAETEITLTFDEALRGATKEFKINGEPIRIQVPEGAREGMKIRVKGRGLAGASGERGDLYVVFRVSDNDRFRRDGNDLYLTETVTAFEAMLGTTRTITTAYGDRLRLTVPPGTQPGEKLRVRGKGVVRASKTGDLYVEIAVETPRLSDLQREALREAAQAAGIQVPSA
jgi:DnaJ-class molecular chaperone